MYKIALADQVMTTPAYLSAIQGIASYMTANPTYTIANFTAELSKSAALHSAIISGNLGAALEIVSGISVADQTSVTDTYRAYLAGVVNGTGYTLAGYIATLQTTDSANQIDLALNSGSLRADFAAIYGIANNSQVLTDASYLSILQGIAGYMASNPSYTIGSFTAELQALSAIDGAIESNNLRNEFASIYGIAVSDQVFTNQNYRYTLAGTAGYMASNPSYTIESFTAELQALSVIDGAIASNNLRNEFASIYGIAVSDQVFTNQNYRYILAGTAGYMASNPSYTIESFVNELSKSASLHAALDSNGLREAFAAVSGISVADQISVTTKYRGYLAGVVNGTGYTENMYIAVLKGTDLANQIDQSLSVGTLRADFAAMYKIAQADQVMTKPAYLLTTQSIGFYMVANPDYTITKFTAELSSSAALHSAISANSLQGAFATVSGISAADQASVTPAYRGYLAGVVNGTGYTMSTYITSLKDFGAVYTYYQPSGRIHTKTTVDGSVYTYTYQEPSGVMALCVLTYADGRTVTYTYDDNGRISYSVQSWDNLRTDYTYDAFNRVITKKLSAADTNGAKSFEYIYSDDSVGRLIKTRCFANQDFTDLIIIYTNYNNSANKTESKTFMQNDAQTSYVYQDSAAGYTIENIMEKPQTGSADPDVYFKYMDNGSGKFSYSIRSGLNADSNGAFSYIYDYYSTGELHYKYSYSDQLWGDGFDTVVNSKLLGTYVFDITGSSTWTAEYIAPDTGEVNELLQRMDVQNKIKGYGVTPEKGFTFTAAMSGEQQNPFKQ
ncbi:MAG: hypothetical protein KJ661_04485, partial [Candidatus Omnitrophica bacterium]|nr:hypothetical protein [Candidatus Omnitrophota bacterium]